VCGGEHYAVFVGQGSESGVGNEVATYLMGADELADDASILRAGLREPGDRRGEPVGDALPCRPGIERPVKGARMGRDAQECADALPRPAFGSSSSRRRRTRPCWTPASDGLGGGGYPL